jgi:hypothetical protein
MERVSSNFNRKEILKMETPRDLLVAEIESGFEAIEEMEITSDDYKKATDVLTKLIDRLNEMDKLELEAGENETKHEIDVQKIEIEKQKIEIEKQKLELDAEERDKKNELEARKFEIDERKIFTEKQKIDLEERKLHSEVQSKAEHTRIEKLSTIASIAVPVVIFIGETIRIVWGTNKTLKFEETGTVTTNAGKKFIDRLFSKK